jgi:hypothetical protein
MAARLSSRLHAGHSFREFGRRVEHEEYKLVQLHATAGKTACLRINAPESWRCPVAMSGNAT